MNEKKIYYGIFRMMLALAVGIFVSAFSYGAIKAQAAETEFVVIEDELVPIAENADSASDAQGDDGGAMILLLGGMLLIIIAVVITVVASFVVTAPIADEI